MEEKKSFGPGPNYLPNMKPEVNLKTYILLNS
jgi:hypothetical protein